MAGVFRILIFLGLFLLYNCNLKSENWNEKLCKKNEELIYSFEMQKNNKIVCLCNEKTEKYIVYRFGIRKKIELEYPPKLDESSWQKFQFYGEKRFGGSENLGFVDYKIQFTNRNVKYEIFEISNDESNEQKTGVKVNVNGIINILSGNYNTRNGTLLKLDDKKMITNMSEKQL